MVASRRPDRQLARSLRAIATRPAERRIGPLIIVALAHPRDSAPEALLQRVQLLNGTLYPTHGSGGCLRAATSTHPDMIYLDSRLPRRLVQQLRSHPSSAHATIEWFTLQTPNE